MRALLDLLGRHPLIIPTHLQHQKIILLRMSPQGKGKRWFRAQEAAAAANQNQLPCDQELAQILESIGLEFRSADLGRKFLLET